MASQALADEQYTYTNEESLAIMLQSIKGNRVCKTQKKEFNLCRSSPLGKFVEPEHCKDQAFSLIDCFIGVQKSQTRDCQDKFQRVLRCAVNNGSCDGDLQEYLGCQ